MIHGTVDVGNSLAAIKKLVFEEKRFTIKELKNVLVTNFEDEENEKIQKLCLNHW